MRIVVLTSLRDGFPAICLEPLASAVGRDQLSVIMAARTSAPGWKSVRRRLRKILRIGPLSAWNGFRMRQWFGGDTLRHLGGVGVESECNRLELELVRVQTINDAITQGALQRLDAQLALSLGNGYIRPEVFGKPRLGTINVHHETLPDYQGAQSVIWQIYNHSRVTGYTIHEIDRGIDTGRILYRETLPIEFRSSLRETVSWNYARLLKASVGGLVRVVSDFESYRAKAAPQVPGRKYTTPTLREFRAIQKAHSELMASANTKVLS